MQLPLGGLQPPEEVHAEDPAGLLRHRGAFLRAGGGDRQRLLHEGVHAAPHGVHRDIGVAVMRRADDDVVRVRLLDQFKVAREGGQFVLAALRLADGAAGIGEADQLQVAQFQDRFQMRLADPAQADNADFQRGHECLS